MLGKANILDIRCRISKHRYENCGVMTLLSSTTIKSLEMVHLSSEQMEGLSDKMILDSKYSV